ncbi:MAG: hypothetical protein ACXVRP_05885 [Solirubrobacteraceae bacterium]
MTPKRLSSDRSGDAAGDRERWMQWREGRLLSAGFAPALAELLSHQERVDLHELLKLVDRGCPPHLAARILAPLDAPLAQSEGGEPRVR